MPLSSFVMGGNDALGHGFFGHLQPPPTLRSPGAVPGGNVTPGPPQLGGGLTGGPQTLSTPQQQQQLLAQYPGVNLVPNWSSPYPWGLSPSGQPYSPGPNGTFTLGAPVGGNVTPGPPQLGHPGQSNTNPIIGGPPQGLGGNVTPGPPQQPITGSKVPGGGSQFGLPPSNPQSIPGGNISPGPPQYTNGQPAAQTYAPGYGPMPPPVAPGPSDPGLQGPTPGPPQNAGGYTENWGNNGWPNGFPSSGVIPPGVDPRFPQGYPPPAPPPPYSPSTIQSQFPNGIPQLTAPQIMGPDVTPQIASPGWAPQSAGPSVAPQSLGPGYAPQSAGTAMGPGGVIASAYGVLAPEFRQQDTGLENALASAGIIGGTTGKALQAQHATQQNELLNAIQPYILQNQQLGQSNEQFNAGQIAANQGLRQANRQFNAGQIAGNQALRQNNRQFNADQVYNNQALAQAARVFNANAVMQNQGMNQQAQQFNAGQLTGGQEYNINNLLNTAGADAGTWNNMLQYIMGLQNQDWMGQLGAASQFASGSMGTQAGAFTPVYQQPSPVNLGGLGSLFTGAQGSSSGFNGFSSGGALPSQYNPYLTGTATMPAAPPPYAGAGIGSGS